jgi:hypothetical protein
VPIYRVAVVETDGRETVRDVEVTPAAPDQRACDRQAQLNAKVLRGETPTRQELDTSRDEWHLRNPATAAIADALGATRRELTREEMRRLQMEDSRPTYMDAVLPDGSILAPIFKPPRSISLTGAVGHTAGHTFSHNCGSGADRVVFAIGSIRQGGADAVTAITYDGVSMGLVASIGTTGTGTASVWQRTGKLAAGATTGANDVVVTAVGSSGINHGAVTAVDIDTTTIHRTVATHVEQTTTSDRTDTLNPVSAVDDLVMVTARIGGITINTITPGTGQTSFLDTTNFGYARGSTKAGAATSTEISYRMEHGSSINLATAISAFALIPASVGGADVDVPTALTAVQAYAPSIDTATAVEVPTALTGVAAYAPEVATGTAVEVPTAITDVAAYAPEIATGSAVEVPAALTEVVAYAPAVGVVTLIEVPTAQTAVAAFAPEVTTGAAVDVPTALTDVLAYAPQINAGALEIEVPTALTSVQAFAPQVGGGIVVEVPTANTSVVAFAPEIDISTTIQVPTALTAVEAYAPTIETGAAVAVPVAETNVVAFPPIVFGGTIPPLRRLRVQDVSKRWSVRSAA